MVLLCGLPTESPFDLLSNSLEDLEIDFEIFCPRSMEDFYLYYEINQGKIVGELSCRGKSIELNSITGVYNRIVDFSITPEYKDLDAKSIKYIKLRSSFTSFQNWLCVTNAKVLNHNKPMLSNCSKPYQMMLIKNSGFKIPESLISNSTVAINSFHKDQKELIYKSASGIRSIVNKYEHDDSNINISACPILFQNLLKGTNYRVHVVGNDVFATKIISSVVDYRYAHKSNENATLIEAKLPQEIEERCVRLAGLLQLPFSGIDLMHTSTNEWYCFEVNPSPGYSYYQNQTIQPISEALAKYLSIG